MQMKDIELKSNYIDMFKTMTQRVDNTIDPLSVNTHAHW